MFLSTSGKKIRKRNFEFNNFSKLNSSGILNKNLLEKKLSSFLITKTSEYRNILSEDRLSYRKEIPIHELNKTIFDFIDEYNKKNNLSLPSFHYDIIEQLVYTNETKSIIEIETRKTEMILDNRHGVDLSIIDLPNSVMKRHVTLLGSFFYFIKNYLHLNLLLNSKLHGYEHSQNKKFRNIILILCHHEYSVSCWQKIIQNFIDTMGNYILQMYGKTMRLLVCTTSQFDIKLDYGIKNELCFFVLLVDKREHVLTCNENEYKIMTVVTIEESYGIETSFFNRNQIDFSPYSLHYIYMNNHYDNDKLMDIHKINKNSVLSTMTGLQKFESKKEKVCNTQEIHLLNFRLFHHTRSSPKMTRELEMILEGMNYEEVHLEYISNSILVDDIVEFDTLNNNFDTLVNIMEQQYHISIPESFRMGFNLDQFYMEVMNQIDSEENEMKKERMEMGMSRIKAETDCCICLEPCQMTKKTKSSNNAFDHHDEDEEDEDDIQILLCCLNKIHSKCFQVSSCPYCRIESIDCIRSNINEITSEEIISKENGMTGFVSYLENNPYKNHQNNPFSILSLLQQVLNSIVDYGKDCKPLKILMIAKESLFNYMFPKIHILISNDYQSYLHFYRYDSKQHSNTNTLVDFENNDDNFVKILTVSSSDSIVNLIHMDTIDMILEIGECVSKENILSECIGIARKYENNKEFCYIQIKKKNNN